MSHWTLRTDVILQHSKVTLVLLVCITFFRTLISSFLCKQRLNATIDYWWNLYNLALYLNNLAVNYCREPHAGLSCPANECFRLTRDPVAPAARMQFKKRCSVKWIGCGHVGIAISMGSQGLPCFISSCSLLRMMQSGLRAWELFCGQGSVWEVFL